jgi:hypothetical protein
MSAAALVLAAACANPAAIVGGISVARRTEEGIGWDARFVLDVDASMDFRGGRVTFALPLPIGETMRDETGVQPIIEGDRITGLCVEPAGVHARTIHAFFTQKATLRSDRATTLGAPIVAGTAVQIVDATVGDELRLEAIRGGGLEAHVGFLAARGIGHDAREDARRLTDTPLLVGHTSIYVRGDDLRSAGPLEGPLVGTRAKSKGSIVGAAFAFVAAVAALLLGARRLKRAATVERADAMLASEIDETEAVYTRRPCPAPRARI